MQFYWKPEWLLKLSKVPVLFQASQAESSTWILFYTLSSLDSVKKSNISQPGRTQEPSEQGLDSELSIKHLSLSSSVTFLTTSFSWIPFVIGGFFVSALAFLLSLTLDWVFGSQFSKTNGELLFKILFRLEFEDKLPMPPKRLFYRVF